MSFGDGSKQKKNCKVIVLFIKLVYRYGVISVLYITTICCKQEQTANSIHCMKLTSVDQNRDSFLIK